MKIDNFALTTFMTCPAKYLLRIKEGYQPRRVSAALGAGQLLHLGIEHWYRDKNLASAMMAVHEKWPVEHPVDDFRNKEKVLATLVEYTKRYPTEPWKIVGDGTEAPMIECSFTIPTGMYLDICPKCCFDHSAIPDGPTGLVSKCYKCGADREPIEYGGIYDLLIEFNGQLYVMDHKTTTMFGPSYWFQYKPNNQLTGYVWAATQMSGRRVGGAIINCIAWRKSSKTDYERQIFTRSDQDIQVWLENVRQIANLIKRAEVTGEYPLNTSACTLYGLCEFHRVHELSNPKEQSRMLEMYYEVKHWDHEDRPA